MIKVNIDGKEYCVETLIFENERLKKEVVASAGLHKMLLNNIKQEMEQIGAIEQETNGETDYLKGINTCLAIIDKYNKTESTESSVKNTIKPIVINPFETEKERQDYLLTHAINTAIFVCGYSGEDITLYSIETLKRLGRYDLLPPVKERVSE